MHGSNKKESKRHSDFKGVIKHRDNLFEVTMHYNNKRTYIGSFKNEIDAVLAYNDLAAKKYGLPGRINTVPVPSLVNVGDCEWRLGPHYFTKEDLGEDMDL